MSKSNEFAFIGGDLRQFFMAEELINKGFHVCIYGLKTIRPLKDLVIASSLKEAMDFGDNMICPVPFSRDQINIFSNNWKQDMTIDNFISHLKKNHKVYGGMIGESVKESCMEKNIPCFDFMEEEEVLIKNAIATAEGTVAEAIMKSPCNLHKAPCLILGFGRCAKVLATKLKGLDMLVTVSARNNVELTMAEASGYTILELDNLKEHIGDFTFIFNTIPFLILNSRVLEFVRRDALIIDIASKPGGTDFERAKEIGINAFLCLGLPGKYAPKTSAEILNSALLVTHKSLSK